MQERWPIWHSAKSGDERAGGLSQFREYFNLLALLILSASVIFDTALMPGLQVAVVSDGGIAPVGPHLAPRFLHTMVTLAGLGG